MSDQETEYNQMQIEADIITKLGELYKLLVIWDNPESETMLGYVAEWISEI